jgi:CheY-like chemotaxis protein
MKQPLILIVDDEEAIVAGLSYRLKQVGYRVAGCFTGREGLETARSAAPDLILLDQCLPELVGSDVLTELRGDPATQHIPVVVLSGADVQPTAALSAGAAAFLRKPYRKDELLDLVESLLAQPETMPEQESWQTAKLY